MLSFWKGKSAARREDGPPAAAIRSSPAEPEPPKSASRSAPADVAAPEGLPAFTLPPAGVSLERSFCQDGFVIVPQVFDQAEIAELRRAAIACFPNNRPPFEAQFSSTSLFQQPFHMVFRNRKFIDSLRAVLGEDFVFVNEFGLHDSFYVGWHTDTASPDGKAGYEFHWSPSFCVVNAAIYLQDNRDNGGGLDVVPGSYLRDDPFAASLRREHGLPNRDRVAEPTTDPHQGAVSLRCQTGDLIIFHLRITHRSSRRNRAADGDADRKLAMFMIAGPNNAQTRRYRAWLDEYDQMNGMTRPVIPDDFHSLLSGIGHSVI
jgi:hypothetical protein